MTPHQDDWGEAGYASIATEITAEISGGNSLLDEGNPSMVTEEIRSIFEDLKQCEEEHAAKTASRVNSASIR